MFKKKTPIPFSTEKVIFILQRHCDICSFSWETSEEIWATKWGNIYDARVTEDNTKVCPKCNMQHDIACNNTVVLGVIPKQQIQQIELKADKAIKKEIWKLRIRLVVDIILIVLSVLLLNNIINKLS